MAAAIVGEAPEAIATDIFLVDPSFIESVNGHAEDDENQRYGRPDERVRSLKRR